MPSGDDLAQLFGALLAHEVRVAPARTLAGAPQLLAVYEGDEDAVAAVWCFDHALANHLASALTLIRPTLARRLSSARAIPEAVAAVLCDIATAAARVMDAPGRPSLRFKALLLPAAPVPPSVGVLVKSRARCADFDVILGGYGGGRLRIALPA